MFFLTISTIVEFFYYCNVILSLVLKKWSIDKNQLSGDHLQVRVPRLSTNQVLSNSTTRIADTMTADISLSLKKSYTYMEIISGKTL